MGLQPAPSITHKTNLDLLRSVAILLVVADHTSLALDSHRVGSWDLAWLGNIGVFFFFVHTSLVLMWSLERKPHTADFYIRRAFRIYPLAWFAIAVALLTHAPLQGTIEHFFAYRHANLSTILQDLFLVQNFGSSPFSIVDVLWTLPLELQMYIALPFLFFFARKERLIWPLLLIWALVVAFSLQKFVDPNEVNLLTAVPIFLPGVMAYVGFARRQPILPTWTLPLLLAVLVTFGVINPTNRKGWYIALCLGLALPSFRPLQVPWLATALDRLARYSYSIYLGHPFALILGVYLLPRRPLVLQIIVVMAAISIIAIAAYHLIEEPFIHLGKRLATMAESRAPATLHPDRPSI